MSLFLSGYTPNPSGPKPIGAGAKIPRRDVNGTPAALVRQRKPTNEASLRRRYGPLRNLRSVEREYNGRQIASVRVYLECDHKLVLAYVPRGELRCAQCRDEGRS